MALKPCRECKKKVSTEATTCPSCGAPKPTTLNKKISSLKAIGLEVKKSNQLKKMAMIICCSNVHCSVWADAVEVPTKPSLKNYKCPRCNSQMIDHNEEKIERKITTYKGIIFLFNKLNNKINTTGEYINSVIGPTILGKSKDLITDSIKFKD